MQKQLEQWVTDFQRFGKTNMDFAALQQKLFDLDPSDRAEDLRRLSESVGGMPQESVQTEENFLQESVEIAEGTMPVEGDYSLSDFARLAGVTLTEAQKTGSAGQLKGKDAIKKNSAGTTKNPTRDKLVGEDFKDDFQTGRDKYNSLNLLRPEKDSTKGSSTKDSKEVKKSSAPKASGTNWQKFLKKHTVALQQIAADPKKTQRFETWLEKWNESIEEAPKPKPIKSRDPSAQYMNDLRKSGAMGAHKDKKRDAKMGKEKHKGKEYTTESIKQMLYRKLNESK